MADLAMLRQRLAEAETAAHNLMTGQQVVEVVRGGKRMRFSDANKGQLTGYIADLNAKIAELQAGECGGLPPRRFIPVRL